MRRATVLATAVLLVIVAGGVSQAFEAKDGSSFTIRPDYSHKEIYDVYEGLRTGNQPPFITTDLALHSGHLLFDYSLRAIEIDRLYALAEGLTREMAGTFEVRPGAKAPLQGERTSLFAYFCVARKALDPGFQVPPVVAAQVAKDLDSMEKHEGFSISAALDSAEDFSQYVPRGHYTRNEQFKRYFKAMMWYGRRMFRVEEARPGSLPIPDPWSEAHRLGETRQMLMITAALYNGKVDGKPAIEAWKALYVPTTLFAGRTEDLNPMEVRALMDKVWGGIPDDAALLDEAKVLAFAKLAAEFSKPKVDSSGAGRKGFAFMAQRFTPDSYVTQCLVTDADVPFGEGVPAHPLTYTGPAAHPFTWGINKDMNPPERRFMPRGLDVMAVFGCDEALEILRAEGDTGYQGYDGMMTFLRPDIGRMMQERKGENLYYAWLDALQPMMKPVESSHVPECLHSREWLRKQIATSLASWAELRHDTILYVKQSYTPIGKSVEPMPRVMPGYVEPQPEVFRRIGRMVAKMQADLAALGVMPKGLDANYRGFAGTCEKLADIADREIAGKALTDEDYAFLRDAALQLKACTVLPKELLAKVTSETDSSMALVADVHTDTNGRQVLEEGVGTPFLLTVRMPIKGTMTELQGAVFSYFEFKQPMEDRLTDEAWQTRLGDDAKRPEPPSWAPYERTGAGNRPATGR